MNLAERMARDCASERQRMIEGVCDLAGRPDLAPTFVSSDRSTSQVLQELLRLRIFDPVIHAGAGAVLPN